MRGESRPTSSGFRGYPSLRSCSITASINRVPEDNDVDDESQCAELILLSLSIMLSQFASFAMENDPRQAVPILAAVELSKRSPALGLVIDRRQNMDRLVDAADLGHGLCQLGRTVANLRVLIIEVAIEVA
jgi:hypothetical protein